MVTLTFVIGAAGPRQQTAQNISPKITQNNFPSHTNLLFRDFLFGVNKEAVGIHVLLTHSLFGDGILRRLLRRVSPAKPTSAPLRF